MPAADELAARQRVRRLRQFPRYPPAKSCITLPAMLDRVAMHQSRLRLPGLGTDGKGVALGSRGLILLASLERLVAFLSLYTSCQSLADVLATLRIEVVKSKMGTREVVLSFAAEGSERMDRIAEMARVALGYTFTGSSRHFVQYRDIQAPFGYDVPEVMAADGDYVLYHNSFSQVYHRERDLDLRGLLLRLHLVQDPAFGRDPGPCLLVAEEGMGPAIVQYLIRSRVEARVGIAQWPPLSALDDAPVQRYLFEVPALPPRMLPLFQQTPGVTALRVVSPGIAIQLGYRHPITLQSCPVFPPQGLVLFFGDQHEPLVLDTMPTLGSVSAFARVEFHGGTGMQALSGQQLNVPTTKVPIRLLPSIEPWSQVQATFIPTADYPTFRHMLYRLDTLTLKTASIAFTPHGAFLLNPKGIDTTPIGYFLRELRPRVFLAAGYDIVPAIDSDVLFQALGAPSNHHVFLLPQVPAIGVPNQAFVPLPKAMIEGQSWAPVNTLPIEPALTMPIPQVVFDNPPR